MGLATQQHCNQKLQIIEAQEFRIWVVSVLQDNYNFVIQDTASKQVAVVDPSEALSFIDFFKTLELQPDFIFNTHHHPDHTGGNRELKKHYPQLQILGPEKEKIPEKTINLNKKTSLSLGSSSITILELPGHTLGHIAYFFEKEKLLFCGDTLFSLGCGRLFEGTPQMMFESLQKILRLPDETLVFCAHEYTLDNARFALSVDPNNMHLLNKIKKVQALREAQKPSIPTLLRDEKKSNPFLRVEDLPLPPSEKKLSAVEKFALVRQMKDRF